MQFKKNVWTGEGISYREQCGRWLVLRYSKGPNRVAGVWICHQDVGERSVTERVKDKLEYVKARLSTPSFGFSSLLLFFPFFFRRFRKIVKSDHYLPHACLSVQLEQLGYHWKDFHEIWYLSIFRKSVEKIQVSLKSDKAKGTLHEDWYEFFVISRPFLFEMKKKASLVINVTMSRARASIVAMKKQELLLLCPWSREWYAHYLDTYWAGA